MSCCPNPLHCILPPYLLDRLAESADPRVRRLAVEAIARSAALRATRTTLAQVAVMAAIPSPDGKKSRLVYDMQQKGTSALPGKLARREGGAKSKDPAVNEAYDHSGTTFDFYKTLFGRHSLDDRGMTLVSSVHVGRRYNNAFWNGEQMAYGDGDGVIFTRFTRAIDVVGHELSHGVVTYTANLEYRNEPGALNEHFADVFGSLIRQWKKRQAAAQADWLIGADIMGPGTRARAIRTFKDEPAFEHDPNLGTDPQPKHLRDKYTGTQDSGGVHINSGIPNHAFFRVATSLGGHAWEKAGRIWYRTLLGLTRTSDFAEMAARAAESAAKIGRAHV